MREFVAGVVLSFLLFIPVDGMAQQCGALGTAELLTITLHPQETDAWCWAAAAQMVMQFMDGEERHRTRLESQCDLVSDVFRDDLNAYTTGGNPNPLHTCCTRTTLDICYRAYFVQEALRVMGFGYNWIPPETFNWNDLIQQLCAFRPFIATMDEGGNGYHVYVVTGFERIATGGIDQKIVHFYDPLLGPKIKPFDQFIDDPGMNETHAGSYIDIAPFPNP